MNDGVIFFNWGYIKDQLNSKNHFYVERVVKCWNRLPRDVVDAPGLSAFKRHLVNALNNMLWLLVNPEVVRQLD